MLTIYKASAGSGKTYNLALTYIRLILGNKDDAGRWTLKKAYDNAHRSALAITFTNKATNEMKQRILSELAALAGRESTSASSYQSRLMADFGCSEADLKSLADKALTAILQDYGYFSVSTIDSFFQRVLRTFAREVEVSGNYEVDLDKQGAYTTAVDQMLTKIVNREHLCTDEENAEWRQLESWIETYMQDRVENGSTFNLLQRNSMVRADLCKFLNALTDEDFDYHYDRMSAYFEKPDRLTSFLKAVKTLSDNVFSEIARLLAEAKGIKDANAASLKFVAWCDSSAQKFCDKLPDSLNSLITKGADHILKKGASVPVADTDRLIEIAGDLIQDFTYYHLYSAVVKNVYRLGLLGRVLQLIKDNLAETGTFLLSNTNAVVRRIIGESDTPFVYERMGQWYNHYLIDEFQDTSKLQWENLRPLVSNSLGEGHDNLLIGDEKQSIYRWRGSDPELLANADREFPGHSSVKGNVPAENTNYRSAKEVVAFNNAFFDNAARDLTYYRNVVQQIAKTDLKGYVSIENVDDQNAAYQRTIAEIKRQLEAGYRLGDIAVLFRKKAEAVEFIKQITANPPVITDTATGEERPVALRIVSEDSMRLDASPAVRRVINLVRYLISSDFTESKRKLSQRRLFALLHNFDSAMASGLDTNAALNDAIGKEDVDGIDLVGDLQNMSLVAVVHHFIVKYIDETSQREQAAYLAALEDVVLDFSCRAAGGDFAEFINWWDTRGWETPVVTSADADALTVMTIHKSKGLEFKCVHIPVANSNESKQGDVFWFDNSHNPVEFASVDPDILPPMIPLRSSKALEGTSYEDQYRKHKADEQIDRLNILYVAFTRAIRELIITVCDSQSGDISSIIADNAQAISAALEAECQTDDNGAIHFVYGKPTAPVQPSGRAAKTSRLQPAVAEEFTPAYHEPDADISIWCGTILDLDDTES